MIPFMAARGSIQRPLLLPSFWRRRSRLHTVPTRSIGCLDRRPDPARVERNRLASAAPGDLRSVGRVERERRVRCEVDDCLVDARPLGPRHRVPLLLLVLGIRPQADDGGLVGLAQLVLDSPRGSRRRRRRRRAGWARCRCRTRPFPCLHCRRPGGRGCPSLPASGKSRRLCRYRRGGRGASGPRVGQPL